MTSPAESGALAIVVVNYGSHLLLASNLVQVSRSVPEADVVVVDNYTSATEQAAVSALCADHDWTLVASPVNAGFGAGMNRGVEEATRRGNTRFLLLNPDATIDPRSVALMVSAVDADPLALVAPTIVTSSGAVWFAGADLHLGFGRSRATRHRAGFPGERFEPWLSGACLLVTLDLWSRVGGFDERYFLYWEDIDLSMRAVRNGGRLTLLEEARAVHDEGGTHGEEHQGSARGKSSVYYFYNIRNRLLFAAQHLEAKDRRRWILNSPLAAWDVLLQGGRRQLLRSAAPLRAAVTGTCAGLALHARERTAQRRQRRSDLIDQR